jgi:argininosuccinate lyase
MRKLWGGVFSKAGDDLVDRFGQSIESDLRFWREDVEGSIAHARMLGSTGILTADESATLVKGLETILAEGPDMLPRDVEDIHTAVEVRLGDLVGPVAGKLHTARSRNDQVATDTRLYLRRRIGELGVHIKETQTVLVDLAVKHKSSLMPGWTHQQPAQPVTLGFHLLAHFWALQREGHRLENLLEFVNVCPLGSGALAGSGFPIDRRATAAELGFAAPIPNALDATSDRSFVLDALHLCALIMLDLSRISQELVLWSGHEFGFVKLSDEVTTGSSIMPQKRNPDMAELIRGRAGRAVGNLTAFSVTMKGLPLGYNRDTQDDKPGLFESLDLVNDSLRLVTLMLEGAEWQTRALARAAGNGGATATDLADFLAERGMPFREAHAKVGEVVKKCTERGWKLHELNADRLATIAPDVPRQALAVLSPRGSASRRDSFGGPGRKAINVQLRRAKALLVREGFHAFW